MTQEFDIFEVLSGGCLLWRASAHGLEQTHNKLVVLSSHSRNEFVAMHLLTCEVVERMQQDNSKAASG
jgi:hypothetical protein